MELGDHRMDGLCEILKQIDAETGIQFPAYAHQSMLPATDDDPAMPEVEPAGDERCEDQYEGLFDEEF